MQSTAKWIHGVDGQEHRLIGRELAITAARSANLYGPNWMRELEYAEISDHLPHHGVVACSPILYNAFPGGPTTAVPSCVMIAPERSRVFNAAHEDARSAAMHCLMTLRTTPDAACGFHEVRLRLIVRLLHTGEEATSTRMTVSGRADVVTAGGEAPTGSEYLAGGLPGRGAGTYTLFRQNVPTISELAKVTSLATPLLSFCSPEDHAWLETPSEADLDPAEEPNRRARLFGAGYIFTLASFESSIFPQAAMILRALLRSWRERPVSLVSLVEELCYELERELALRYNLEGWRV